MATSFSRFLRNRRRSATIAWLAVAAVVASQSAPLGGAEQPIVVPAGSPQELLDFIRDVKQRRPAAGDLAAVTDHLIRVENAVVEAADKVVAASPSEAEHISAVGEKLSALMVLRRLEVAGAEGRLKAYLGELSRDPHPSIPPLGKIYALATRLQDVDHGNHAEIEQLTADVREHLRSARLDAKNLSVAFQTARAAEQAGLTKLALETYREFAAVFARSDDPAVVENARKLEASARWLALPGTAPEIAGKLLDGTPLDWKKYEGKTVLVVFWATWCGPCVAELPILRDLYEKYRDRGFEVVSISLDDDRGRLDDFVRREQLPWAVLFGDDPQHTGWNHPTAEYYGVMSIPRGILVGKDGTVTSLEAHGELLWDLLAAAIGPAVVKEPRQPADVKPVDAGAPPRPKP